ncbi:MAG: PEP/pyruvate-binding domain-containing protein, partial [Nitrospira sp.]
MNVPIILPLDACTDRASVGGKAAGLARLLADGAPVPRGICLTIDAARCFYRDLPLDASAVWDRIRSADGGARTAILAECRERILHGRWPNSLRLGLEQAIAAQHHSAGQRWAVRSSATNEDEHRASFAGQYDTVLGVATEELLTAVQTVWASLWNERAMEYQRRTGWSPCPPEMAVVIQPVLKANAGGVLYTVHPVTGRADQLLVNAVPGLAPDLVDGHVTPDQFVLGWDAETDRVTVQERIVGAKASRTDVGPDGLVERPLSPVEQHRACVSDDELLALVRLAKRIERAQGRPLDIEWAMDPAGLWLLQARPVTVTASANPVISEPCEWSRTNFKETMPEVPSPLGLSFLEQFMDLFLMGPYR